MAHATTWFVITCDDESEHMMMKEEAIARGFVEGVNVTFDDMAMTASFLENRQFDCMTWSWINP